jgi:WD40 repeat protein
MLKKIIKKYWLILILGIAVVALIIVSFLTKPKPKTESDDKEIPEFSKFERFLGLPQKTTLSLTTKQEAIQVIFDQSLEEIQQPFILPKTIELLPGDYTLQAFKEEFETKTITFNIKNKEQKEIYIELSPSLIKPNFYRLLTEKNIKNAGWRQTELLYQVRNEIKEARRNSTVANLPQDSITQFTPSGNILVNSQNKLSLITKPSKVTPLSLSSPLAILSPSGEKLAFLNDHFGVEVVETTNKLTLAKFTPEKGSISKISWSQKEEILSFISLVEKTNYIYLAEITNNKLKNIFSTSSPISGLAISPEEEYLAISTPIQTKIYNLKEQTSIDIEPEGGLLSSLVIWRNENEILLIEKVKQFDRILDKIWQVNPLTGEKKFLTISAPLVNRISFEIKPILSPNKNALALIENNGPAWLLLLEGSLKDFFPEAVVPAEQNDYSAP